MAPFLYDVNSTLRDGIDGPYIRRDQVIPNDFLDDLRTQKEDSARTLAGETHRVASIPVALVETWMRQGFNVYQEPAKAILARLRAEGLDAFITTTKM